MVAIPFKVVFIFVLFEFQCLYAGETVVQSASPSPMPSLSIVIGSESKPVPLSQGIKCISLLDRLAEKEVNKLPEGGSPKVSGILDIVFPIDKKQYTLLNKMAIVAVSVYSKDGVDLPTNHVKLTIEENGKANVFRLPSIFPFAPIKEIPSWYEFGEKLGKYQQSIYFFVPIYLLRKQGEISIVLKDVKSTLPLIKIPAKIQLDFVIKDKHPEPAEKILPDSELVLALLAKNYCLGVRK